MPFCLQARSVPEDCESADALKAVAEDITAQTFVVMSVDLVTDVCLEVSFSRFWSSFHKLSLSTMSSCTVCGWCCSVMHTLLIGIRIDRCDSERRLCLRCTFCETRQSLCSCPRGECPQLQRQSWERRQRMWSMLVEALSSCCPLECSRLWSPCPLLFERRLSLILSELSKHSALKCNRQALQLDRISHF